MRGLLGAALLSAATLGGGCLSLTRFARLHVLTPAAQFLQQSRPLHETLELLEGDVDAIVVAELHFAQWPAPDGMILMRFPFGGGTKMADSRFREPAIATDQIGL
jgi:hypothetical protein